MGNNPIKLDFMTENPFAEQRQQASPVNGIQPSNTEALAAPNPIANPNSQTPTNSYPADDIFRNPDVSLSKPIAVIDASLSAMSAPDVNSQQTSNNVDNNQAALNDAVIKLLTAGLSTADKAAHPGVDAAATQGQVPASSPPLNAFPPSPGSVSTQTQIKVLRVKRKIKEKVKEANKTPHKRIFRKIKKIISGR